MPTDYTDYSVPRFFDQLTKTALGINQILSDQRREKRLIDEQDQLAKHREQLAKRQAGLDSLNTMLKIVDAPTELQGPLFDDFMQRGQQITGIAPNPETVAAMKGAMKKRQDDLRQTMRGMMELAKGNPDALTEEMMMSIMGDKPLDAMEKFSKFYEMGQFNKAMQDTEGGGGISEGPLMEQAEPPQPTPQPAGQRPSTSTPYVQDVMSEAVKQGVPPSLAATILRAENSGPTATSPKGAMGLMQLMPDTAKRYGVENPFDIQQNIRGGVAFIKDLYQKFGNKPDLIMAAYNAGEGAVQKHGGVPPFQETQAYVKRGMEMLGAQPSTARDIGISASERAQLSKIDNEIRKQEKILSVAGRFSSQTANTKADNARQRISQLRIDRDRITEIPRAAEKERVIGGIKQEQSLDILKSTNPREAYAAEMFGLQYGRLDRPQQASVNKRIHDERLEEVGTEAKARADVAQENIRYTPEQQKNLADLNQALTGIDELMDIPQATLDKWVGWARMPANQAMQAFQTDKEFQDFAAVADKLRTSELFSRSTGGGGALTPTEAKELMAAIPTGREIGGAPQFLAKLRYMQSFLDSRIRLMDRLGRMKPGEASEALREQRRETLRLRKQKQGAAEDILLKELEPQ